MTLATPPSKIGRNDPCYCGSGKKYKVCHLLIDDAARATQRRLEQAQDTLLPKLFESAQALVDQIPAAFQRYWDGRYTPEQMTTLEEVEEKGAERFLSWFVFDYQLDDGRTLVQRLAAGDAALDMTDDERQLMQAWTGVRLRPYVADTVRKGREIVLRDMLAGEQYTLIDQSAAKAVELGEVLVVHLLPVGTRHFVGGAAAHLTADTADKLREFADLHLEAVRRDHPDATWIDLLSARSEVLNHFVMQLPVEAPDPTIFEKILLQTRTALQLTGESLGVVKPQPSVTTPTAADTNADADANTGETDSTLVAASTDAAADSSTATDEPANDAKPAAGAV